MLLIIKEKFVTCTRLLLTTIILILIARVSGFYLPGLAPVNYCEFNKPADNCRSDVKLYVNRLD